MPLQRTDLELSIPACFEQRVRQNKQRIAVKVAEQQICYHALNQLSNRISHRVYRTLDHHNQPVALLMDQGIYLVASILAVLKAGKTYVPIDPSDPAERIAPILKIAEIKLVLTDPANLTTAIGATRRNQQIINIDEIAPKEPKSDLQLELSPDSPACIFFTSGSTGQPKGVVDSHRNVIHNIMRYTNNLQITKEDHITLIQGCSFSGSLSNLFGALLNGATLYPFDLRRNGTERLVKLIARQGITIFHSVPSVFERLAAHAKEFTKLRIIRLEGDECNTKHVALYQKYFAKSCMLANGLGATETGLIRQYQLHTDTIIQGNLVPIGFATEDMESIIIDEDANELPANQVGEIAVKSAYLALGYWHDPQLTRTAFKALPGTDKRLYRTGDIGRIRNDGNMEYLGRKDQQITIEGIRIDRQGVEKALRDLPQIVQAALHAEVDPNGRQRLIAYLVWQSTELPITPAYDITQLRKSLVTLFPSYMLPVRLVTLKCLPMDANGKIDRKSLPQQPEAAKLDFVAPQSTEEHLIAALWVEILGLPRVGLYDNFFELGGSSLDAVNLLILLERKTGIKLSDGSLLQAQTVQQMATLLGQKRPAQCLVPIRRHGVNSPFFCIHDHTGRVLQYRKLAYLLGDDQPFYALQSKGQNGQGTPLFRIEDMAACYIEEIRRIQPQGPWRIGGYCFGGLVAFEMARQLNTQGQTVELLVLMDTVCPRGQFTRRVSPRRHLYQLSGLSLGEKIGYLGRKLSNMVQPVSKVLAGHHNAIDSVDKYTNNLMPLPWELSCKANKKASNSYKPGRYNGNVLSICIAPAKSYDEQSHAGWHKLVRGKFTTVNLLNSTSAPNNRLLFQEPYLSRLAKELKYRLGVNTPRDSA